MLKTFDWTMRAPQKTVTVTAWPLDAVYLAVKHEDEPSAVTWLTPDEARQLSRALRRAVRRVNGAG